MSTSVLDKPLFRNRTIKEWFISLPTFIVLLTIVFLSSGEYIHARMLAIGNSLWPGYTTELKKAFIPERQCQSIEKAVESAYTKWLALPEEDEFGFEKGPWNPGAVKISVEQSNKTCTKLNKEIKAAKKQVTPNMKRYLWVETSIQQFVGQSSQIKKPLFIFLVLLCAVSTTFSKHHISLRPITTQKDQIVSSIALIITFIMLLVSSTIYYQAELNIASQGIQVHDMNLHKYWIVGFATLLLVNIYIFFTRKRDNLPAGDSYLKSLLSIPLFGIMGITAGIQFFFLLDYPTGISVTMTQITDFIDVFLKLALYIWLGMLLKQTRLAKLFFDVLRPWNMSSELMCCIVLIFAAVPTAYTGASGIFIIAAGAIIFQELRMAGTRGQLALATTAMSGSMGVVLKPCLMIVLIAAVNDSITTDELFGYGMWVFVLTAVLFFIVSQITRQEKISIAPVSEAMPKSIAALVPILPYVLITLGIISLYKSFFDQGFDEYSAPVILPVVLLTIIIYEKVFSASIGNAMDAALGTSFRASAKEADTHVDSKDLEEGLRFATTETTDHIGALLLLMMLSLCVGGLIERSGVMSSILPEVFPSIWVLLSVLVVFLVVVGMIIDPMGAIILVNATITPIAYANGIHPLHFWLITLVAFELGYLSPPVALNHLLTRHIVGEEETAKAYAEPLPKDNFWYRYERYLLPITVMAIALVIVAYVPVLIGYENLGFSEYTHK